MSDLDDAAYRFVSSLVQKADSFDGIAPSWYGWALREAFVAGSKFGRDLTEKNRRLDAALGLLREATVKHYHSPHCGLQRPKGQCNCGLDDFCRRAAQLLKGEVERDEVGERL